jgi:hypothetical protein
MEANELVKIFSERGLTLLPEPTCMHTARIIEVFHRGRRIASHQHCYGGRRHVVPILTTCLVPIAAMPDGGQIASAAGPLASAPAPKD